MIATAKRKAYDGPIILRMTPVFSNADAEIPAKLCTGKYYLWCDRQLNGRYPITTEASRRKMHGYITGYVDATVVDTIISNVQKQ